MTRFNLGKGGSRDRYRANASIPALPAVKPHVTNPIHNIILAVVAPSPKNKRITLGRTGKSSETAKESEKWRTVPALRISTELNAIILYVHNPPPPQEHCLLVDYCKHFGEPKLNSSCSMPSPLHSLLIRVSCFVSFFFTFRLVSTQLSVLRRSRLR